MKDKRKAVCFENAGDGRKLWIHPATVFTVSEPFEDTDKKAGLCYIYIFDCKNAWCVNSTVEEVLDKLGW